MAAGRFGSGGEDKKLIVDAAHNPDGIRVLRESLDTLFKAVPKRFIFGCLKNKDYHQMVKLLFKETPEIGVIHPPLARSFFCIFRLVNNLYPFALAG